ncbi:recombinase family protein [Kitasatospora sp. NPDC051914]|uniref:recombinase family protein n=1 Tax=Kitasatospora sp. NPDC051914 TaxID=3154945 RepID=UPI00341A50D0
MDDLNQVSQISQVSRDEIRARKLARMTEATGVARRSRADWAGESAAIYCRISHVNDEDQTGVERQERVCRDIAERLGLTVRDDRVFVDNNRSAWKRDRKRPGWNALLDEAREGGVRHILTYHPDRLMRQPRDLEELLQISDDHDITLHGEANQRNLADPDDRFFLRIEVAHACRSSDDTSRRLKTALIERAQDGKPHTGKRRYGYDKSGTTIIPAEAEIVREIYERYLNGETITNIARDLNTRKLPTALGGEWNAANVTVVLRSRHVAGLRVFRGEVIGAGEWPAIIDRGLWDEVQERRTLRAPAGRGRQVPKRFYLLRGVVTCKKCGTQMKGSGGKYLCNRVARVDSKRCYRAVSAEPLESFVRDAAIRLLTKLDVTGRDTATALSDADREALEADRQELTELKDMWEKRELTTREYRQMKKQVDDRISAVERKAVVRPAVEILEGLVGSNAEASWKDLEKAEDYARMNAVLRFLFAAVIIGDSHDRKNRLDYGRIDIEPNPL